jgi:hypothetical protein
VSYEPGVHPGHRRRWPGKAVGQRGHDPGSDPRRVHGPGRGGVGAVCAGGGRRQDRQQEPAHPTRPPRPRYSSTTPTSATSPSPRSPPGTVNGRLGPRPRASRLPTPARASSSTPAASGPGMQPEQQTVSIAGADGSVSIVGQLKSGTSGKRIEINPTGILPARDPLVRQHRHRIRLHQRGVSSGTDVALGMNSSDVRRLRRSGSCPHLSGFDVCRIGYRPLR